MSLADNIKKLREDKGLMQKEVAAQIGLKPAHYNKIENGLVEPSIETLDKLSAVYGISIDAIVHLKKDVPAAVQMEDKSNAEQIRLMAELNDKDKSVVMAIIDTMLTKQRFQDFFQKNIPAAN